MEMAQPPPATDSSLRELLQDRLSDPDRAALEAWVSVQLDNERQGWKNKLQMAMKEIEKERRLALEVHEAIHQLNDRLEQQSPALNLYREPSMYYSSDKDMKVSHILTLEKNVESLLTLVEKTLDEKAEFLKSFASLEQDSVEAASGDTEGLESEMTVQPGSLTRFPKELLALREELQRVSKTAEETEKRLTKEIDMLTESVQMQEQLLEDEKKMHLKQVESLQGIITSQIPSRRETDYHNVPLIRPVMRECCIQTDMDMVQSNGDIHEGSKGLQLPSISPNDKSGCNVSVSSVTELSSAHENEIGSSIVSNKSSGSSSLHFKPNTHHARTRTDLSQSLDSQDFEQKHAIENLRNQVVTFAEKLEKARGKMNEYEQQMSLIRTSPRGKRLIGVPASQRKSDMAGVALHRKWKSSEGYLCGVRKDVAENGGSEGDSVNDKRKAIKDRVMNGHHTSHVSGTNTCFRCHKLYRTKENHRLACRYHPKSKQKIERYDNTGKLIKIVQVWECCMQRDDAIGCSVGEHI